ncbi:linker for activation of T-cells family member 1 [Discoglossus pictus]
MDSLIGTAIFWALVFVLPVTTALCISCRKRTPTRIVQSVDDYVYKPNFTSPPSSFIVMTGYPHRSMSSPAFINSQTPFLSIPKSPALPDSRRSSLGVKPVVQDTDSLPSYENEMKNKNDEDDDEDGNYTNDNYNGGYIVVLPDDSETNAVCALTVPLNHDNSASVSSTTIGDDYENVEKPRDSMGESLEYVNVPSMQDVVKQSSALSSDIDYQSESEEDLPDYENVEKKCQD